MQFSPTHLHPLSAVTGYDIVVHRDGEPRSDGGFVAPVTEVVQVIDGGDRYAEATAAARALIAAGGIYGAHADCRYSCGCRFAATVGAVESVSA